MGVKRVIKRFLTFVWHTLVSVKLYFGGARNFYIGPQMTINKVKYLKLGHNFSIGRNSRFLFVKSYHGGTYSPSAKIGSGVSIGNRFTLLSAAPIEIGNDCLIASDVLISSENHGMNVEASESYGNLPLEAAPVVIGRGCWIGEKAVVLPGVTIGDRCIVGAGAIVTHDVPPHSMVAGVPAKVIKTYNFDSHKWE